MRNWWYYHKWYVICSIGLLGVIFYLIGNAFGLFKKAPDYQIAYVGETKLSQEVVDGLIQDFEALSQDFNQDGQVIVAFNQYPRDFPAVDFDSAYHQYASEISLIGDITDCESYFFLMDDPELFQREYQLLAQADGTCPESWDYDSDGKALSCMDCPQLASIDALSGLYIGRRCFYTDKTTANLEQCSQLWDFLISTP